MQSDDEERWWQILGIILVTYLIYKTLLIPVLTLLNSDYISIFLKIYLETCFQIIFKLESRTHDYLRTVYENRFIN